MYTNLKTKLNKLKNNKKGFTLIELIVVIAIIGVLAAMLVPAMSGYISEAKSTKNEANARTFYTAAQAAVTSLEITGTTIESTDTNVKAKLSQLMGEKALVDCGAYTITVDSNGGVTQITINGNNTYPQIAPSASPGR